MADRGWCRRLQVLACRNRRVGAANSTTKHSANVRCAGLFSGREDDGVRAFTDPGAIVGYARLQEIGGAANAHAPNDCRLGLECLGHEIGRGYWHAVYSALGLAATAAG